MWVMAWVLKPFIILMTVGSISQLQNNNISKNIERGTIQI
jgi:hypothetical protein